MEVEEGAEIGEGAGGGEVHFEGDDEEGIGEFGIRHFGVLPYSGVDC